LMQPNETVASLLARIEMGISMGLAALDQAQEEMVAAIAEERERCAKVAESCATKDGEDWNDNPGQGAWDSACDHIAEQIRAVPKRAAGKE